MKRSVLPKFLWTKYIKFYTWCFKMLFIQDPVCWLMFSVRLWGKINAFPQSVCAHRFLDTWRLFLVFKFIELHVTVLSHVSSKGRTTEGSPTEEWTLTRFPQCVSSYVPQVCVTPGGRTAYSQGFTALCVAECCLKCSCFWKASPHSLQSWRLFPVCVRICISRCDGHLRAFPQSWHSWGLFLVCVLMCTHKFAEEMKAFSHRWHL